MADELQPDVMSMVISLPVIDGLATARSFQAALPEGNQTERKGGTPCPSQPLPQSG